MPINTVWNDTDLYDILTWDNVYWGTGSLYRTVQLVNIGVAAGNHDVGWDIPSTGNGLYGSIKLLKALTAAGGATGAGLGTVPAAPSKYGFTTAVTINAAGGDTNATWNDGASDDLQISAVDIGGNPIGTLAGSGVEDVKVVLYWSAHKDL
jgi:hypothetical protein